MTLDDVVMGFIQASAHTEVGNLDGRVFTHQAVACGEITVDKVLRGEILHGTGNLAAHVGECSHADLESCGRGVSGYDAVKVLQVLVEVTFSHVLHHDVGAVGGARTKSSDHIGVV